MATQNPIQNPPNDIHPNQPDNGAAAPEDFASDAKRRLREIGTALNADDPLTDRQKAALAPLMRFDDALLSLVCEAHDQFGSLIGAPFDAVSVQETLQFERQVRPVATLARGLASRIDQQVLVRRAPAAAACLGLIQAMRGVARLPKGAVLRPVLKQIAAMMRPRRRRAAATAALPEAPT